MSGKLTFNLINAAMSCSFFPSLPSFLRDLGRGGARFRAISSLPLLTAIPRCRVKFLLGENPRRGLINGSNSSSRQVSRKFAHSWFVLWPNRYFVRHRKLSFYLLLAPSFFFLPPPSLFSSINLFTLFQSINEIRKNDKSFLLEIS